MPKKKAVAISAPAPLVATAIATAEAAASAVTADVAATQAAEMAAYEEQMEQFKREILAALDNRKSSEQEYDKLIVYLAGGGLALTIGFVKDLMQLTKSAYLGCLLTCWALYALCLLTNLWSHWLAKKAFDSYLREEKLDVQQRKKWWVEAANVICFLLVAGGTLSFVLFVFLNLVYHVRPPERAIQQPAPKHQNNQPRPQRAGWPHDTAHRHRAAGQALDSVANAHRQDPHQ
jgi:hypothetical protein